MKLLRWGPLALVMTVLAVLFAPLAQADPVSNAVVAGWSQQSHVVFSPAANPALKNPQALNGQIGQTGLPLYVAVTDQSQASVTPTTLGQAFSAKLGHPFQGVILVVNSHGIYAGAKDTPGGSQAAGLAASVAKQYGRNIDAGLASYVTQFKKIATSAAQQNVPSGSNGGGAHKSSWTWLWWLLGVIVFLAVLVAVTMWALGFKHRSEERAENERRVKRDLIRAKSKVDDLDGWVSTAPVDVSTEHGKATLAFADAKANAEKGDYDSAATHLETVTAAYAKANRKVNPEPPVSVSEGKRAARAVPQEERKQATVNAKTSSGQTVVINNNDYRTSQSSSYANHWPGGYYNNVYWSPGYYPYSFWGGGYSWGLTDVLLADALIDDHWGGRYDYNDGYSSSSGGGDYAESTQDDNWQGDTSSDGGGDYDTGTDTSSSDGGGTFDDSSIDTSYSAPDPTPSYTAPDTSSDDWSGGGGDYGGGGSDYSGGSDFSGGGSDFSGGGSDW